MLGEPQAVLRSGKGKLSDTPFAELLGALLLTRRTAVLSLSQQALEKQVYVEDGAPVACSTNLVQETLGKFLVERGLLTEDKYLGLLAESASRGVKLEELLVEKGVLDAERLQRQLQANLGHRLLDCFRWVDANYRLLGTETPPETPQKTNPAQMVYTGACTTMPYELVEKRVAFAPEQRFTWVHEPPLPRDELRPGPRDEPLFEALGQRPTVPELLAKTGMGEEEVRRRLYGLAVLGYIDLAERVPVEPPAPPAAASALASTTSPPEMAAAPRSEDLPALRPQRNRAPWVVLALLALGAGGGAVFWLTREPAEPTKAPVTKVVTTTPPPSSERLAPPALPTPPSLPAEGLLPAPLPRNLELSASGIRLRLPLPEKGPARSLVVKGAKALGKKDAAAARALFEKAIAADEKSAEAWYGLALSQYELRDDVAARAGAERAVVAQPAHAMAHLLAGYLALAEGDLPGAREHLSRYVEAKPPLAHQAEVAGVLEQLSF